VKPPASASEKSGPTPAVEPPKAKPSSQLPAKEPRSASKSSRSRAEREPKPPVKSRENVLLDQVQGLIDAARSTSGKAKGFIAI
jgi:hypothetical protein